MEEVVQIRIGKHRQGIIGLKAALAEIAEQGGHMPVEEVGKRLREKLTQSNYIPDSRAEIYEKAFEREYNKFIGAPLDDEGEDTDLHIKVLGPGCPQCDRLEQEVMAAMAELGIAVDIEHVRNPADIGRWGVMGTPALIINNEVKIVGRVPTRSILKTWIEQAVLPKKNSSEEK